MSLFSGKKELDLLREENQGLKKKLSVMEEHFGKQLRVLKQQLASALMGVPPRPESVLQSLPYSEIPKEEVVDFIGTVPNLLILDVRTDTGWSQGHIPDAKHIPAPEVFTRLVELPDKTRPILTICANGNTALGVCQLLTREGYQNVFNALGGMAGFPGEVIRPEVKASDLTQVKGTDRELVAKVLAVIDQDVRPGLQRDGGDIEVVEVESGVVKVKMVGACVGCGSQKRTVEDGIKLHLQRSVPEIEEIVDLSMGLAT